MARINPFRPGGIVGTGMFAGRYQELRLLEQILLQTKNGNPQHFLLHGERGIGKSSLLFYFNCIASGKFKSVSGEDFNFLTVTLELENHDQYPDLMRKVGNEFARVLRKEHKAKEVAKAVWEFVTRWEVFGVKYSPKSESQYELIEQLTEFVSDAMTELEMRFDGVLIIIDEADKSASNTRLGEFAKLFTERLTKRNCNKVSLILAGLTPLIEALRQSHESAPRIFELCNLEPLLEPERAEVIIRGIREANRVNTQKTEIAKEAIDLITMYSEGYPHFIQQFAYSAFAADTDCMLDKDDVMRGAWGEGGAFEQLGRKYYHELYFDKIGSDEYRNVLSVMAGHLDDWVSKDELRDTLKIKPSTLNNALTALKKKRIIIPEPGIQGQYRLPTKSFAAWIKAFTSQPA